MSLREHIAEHFWSYTIVGGLLGWAAVKGEQYAKADQYAADAYDMNLHVWLCGRCHHVFDEKEEADECCLDEVDETAESVQAEMFIESDGLAVAVEGLDGTYLTDGEIKMGYTSASEAGFEPKELKTVMWVWDDIEGYGAYLATEQITFLSESFGAESINPSEDLKWEKYSDFVEESKSGDLWLTPADWEREDNRIYRNWNGECPMCGGLMILKTVFEQSDGKFGILYSCEVCGTKGTEEFVGEKGAWLDKYCGTCGDLMDDGVFDGGMDEWPNSMGWDDGVWTTTIACPSCHIKSHIKNELIDFSKWEQGVTWDVRKGLRRPLQSLTRKTPLINYIHLEP